MRRRTRQRIGPPRHGARYEKGGGMCSAAAVCGISTHVISLRLGCRLVHGGWKAESCCFESWRNFAPQTGERLAEKARCWTTSESHRSASKRSQVPDRPVLARDAVRSVWGYACLPFHAASLRIERAEHLIERSESVQSCPSVKRSAEVRQCGRETTVLRRAKQNSYRR